MTQTKLENLSARVDGFCDASELTFVFEEKTGRLIEELLNGAYQEPEHKNDYLRLLERIRIRCNCSERLMSATIGNIAYDMYDKNAPKMAESSFRIAAQMCPESQYSTNLAYVCRRHRDAVSSSDVEIIDLLLGGVKKRDPFGLINMALHFAQNLGREEDWKLADRMIGLIDKDKSNFSSAVEWWSKLAQENDDEGLLALCWMERHGKHMASEEVREKFSGLRSRCANIPQWVFEPMKKE